MAEISIEDLPRTVLEHIFHFLRPYGSLNNARQVNSRWRYIIDNSVKSMKRRYSSCKDFSWIEITEKVSHEGFSLYISERGGHSACYSKSDNSMYMFGGCTARYSPLSDFWKLNLDTLEWQRIAQQGDIPSPRSLGSLVDCGEVLILCGGYARSSMNPINQRVQFFGDLFYYVKKQEKWIQVGPEFSSIKALASHGASVIQNRWMVIYGGSTGEDFSGDVYAYDLHNQIWASVQCHGEPPSPRHGHCQVVVDDYNLLIIGGAGVIRGVYSDIFLLTFEPSMDQASWKQIKVLNKELWPPHFWGIRGCRVANKVVFLSRPQYVDLETGSHRQRPTLSTAVSVTSSSSSGQSRLSSPDSPQDRRAVAAAFSNASKESNISKSPASSNANISRESNLGEFAVCNTLKKSNLSESSTLCNSSKESNLTESAALRRKSQFLTSRSLDEQKADELSKISNNSNLTVLGHQQPLLLGHNSHNKSLELQRACSIPAIIVGEIPKLIITDDLCTPKQPQKSTPIWYQCPVQPNAPPTLILYSLVEANGELIVFGGMKDALNANPFLNSGSLTICHIPDDVKKQLRDFRFKKSSTTNAIILKIDREDQMIKIEEVLEDCNIEEIQDQLPGQQPRFVVLSYELKHADGRVSFPMCLLFYSPSGCSTELQILYAGSRNHLVNECELTKSAEVRDLEDITKEFLDSKFS
ncbi:hypothetical protein FO519_005454 [Halicephalobus sp. NKZ332]|nr:hypothetical protein FO519_005454 [Halicephalobus sp. NKZ332]